MQDRHKRRIKNWTAWVAIIMSASIGLLIIFWTLQPFRPVVTIDEKTISVTPTTAKAGEFVVLNYYFCKNQPTTGFSVRYLKDELLYFLPTTTTNFDVGCQMIHQRLDIPKNLPPDTYTYNAELTYKVNPIRTVTYKFSSDPFTVTQ